MVQRSISAYAKEVRPHLSGAVFAPAYSRLLWLPAHLLNVSLAFSAIAFEWVTWPWQLLLAPVIGASYAGLTFVAHESLHGALVRNRAVRRLVGFIGFLPFGVSPRLWEAWHNRVHHGNTNRPGIDPDAYPTLQEYNESRAVRLATDLAAPGRNRLAGAISLLIGFSVQSAHMLVDARKRKMLEPKEHARAIAETLLAASFWIVMAWWLGAGWFLAAYVLPMAFGNAIIMALILTNHSLSPHTDVNDPLANSLSVTGPRFIEWLTLGFGFHVEHHLFPAMSARHARELRSIVQRLWPAQYQSLPYFTALGQLHRSPRVYESPSMLVDPNTGKTWPALAPTGNPATPPALPVAQVRQPALRPLSQA